MLTMLPAPAARIEGKTACMVCRVPIRLTGDHALEVGWGHGLDAVGNGDAGRVNQDVDAAEVGEGAIDGVAHVGAAGDVGGEDEDVAAGVGDIAGEGVEDGLRGGRGGRPSRPSWRRWGEIAADAAGSPGDHNGAIAEIGAGAEARERASSEPLRSERARARRRAMGGALWVGRRGGI